MTSTEAKQWKYAEKVAKYLKDRGVYFINPIFPGSILEEAVDELGLQDKVDLTSMAFSSKVMMSLNNPDV